MRALLSLIGWGVLIWLIPFILGFVLLPLQRVDRPLYHNLLTLVMAVCVLVAGWRHWRSGPATWPTHLGVGLLWMAISIASDLPFFLGMFQMPWATYLSEIAASYALMPILTVALGVRAGHDLPMRAVSRAATSS
jgi:hypothetical protein